MCNEPKNYWKSWQSLAHVIEKNFHPKNYLREEKKLIFLASHEILQCVFRQNLWVAVVKSVQSQWECHHYIIFRNSYEVNQTLEGTYWQSFWISIFRAFLPCLYVLFHEVLLDKVNTSLYRSLLSIGCASSHKHRLFYCTKYPLFSECTYILPFFCSNM